MINVRELEFAAKNHEITPGGSVNKPVGHECAASNHEISASYLETSACGNEFSARHLVIAPK